MKWTNFLKTTTYQIWHKIKQVSSIVYIWKPLKHLIFNFQNQCMCVCAHVCKIYSLKPFYRETQAELQKLSIDFSLKLCLTTEGLHSTDFILASLYLPTLHEFLPHFITCFILLFCMHHCKSPCSFFVTKGNTVMLYLEIL